LSSVTATDFLNTLDSDDTAETLEPIMDLAIDALNIFGCEIDNLDGGAGSKTVTLTSQQRGAVFIITRVIYKSFYKDEGGSTGLGPASISTTDLLANATVWTQIKEIAQEIKATSSGSIAFVVGEDTSGLT
jgi:hypothetical protein